jgi:hypothetical protein
MSVRTKEKNSTLLLRACFRAPSRGCHDVDKFWRVVGENVSLRTTPIVCTALITALSRSIERHQSQETRGGRSNKWPHKSIILVAPIYLVLMFVKRSLTSCYKSDGNQCHVQYPENPAFATTTPKLDNFQDSCIIAEENNVGGSVSA